MTWSPLEGPSPQHCHMAIEFQCEFWRGHTTITQLLPNTKIEPISVELLLPWRDSGHVTSNLVPCPSPWKQRDLHVRGALFIPEASLSLKTQRHKEEPGPTAPAYSPKLGPSSLSIKLYRLPLLNVFIMKIPVSHTTYIQKMYIFFFC
jgi:hypothetical protein